ncbi:MAG: Molybdenum cofactor cytidylyltransferase [Actinobacteria bacterium]|uniref:Molybdenum cofactor cytidylyltransferase n=2 Tax=Candidatus Hakubella thermalkaliphila TaxID=2754717 RepID=A0A6V8P4R7_9ACTN|nr:nucleotidyltransferase family protein [Candidatus Hakubella thermalkaliphila]MBT9170147.1 Molybdenum cofactor cytidylyltransferase [Actinomycetota bacterium]GFP27303.1 molybdenum cofactor cytidylyltransferase [Candidatus Hakubella thermalkaliphila]GFP29902.1 molybdenum cofactor cytidylyltransferase [Candidatus Hakubella thermalkaliphila]GFP39569.1 molybdenum cofactor cytidylyltransferase [Candidatus Hakubella thermalkaliphila]GFP42466.1 molybdenum cofactor cytidylyltransferase [Candidatus H
MSGSIHRRVSAILLAAGSSDRFGRLKQLLDVQGKKIIQIALESLLRSRVSEIVVVLGCAREQIKEYLKGYEVKIVDNPQYRKGQSSSIKRGLESIDQEAEAALFMLSDTPLVGHEIIDLVIGKYEETGSTIVAPFYGDKRGHPVLFGRELFGELKALEGDVSGSGVIRRHAERVVRVQVDSDAVIFDVDDEQDYQRLLRRVERRN